MDEDEAVEVGRRRHGPGWVAQDWAGHWNWYQFKPVKQDGWKFWMPSPDDPNYEFYEIGYSDWSEYWEDSLREVT